MEVSSNFHFLIKQDERLARLGALAEVDWSPKAVRDWENFKTRAALNEKRLAALGVNYRPLTKPE